jgi:ubiquinone/menaquinone biosynthesis C-methylase UbiE
MNSRDRPDYKELNRISWNTKVDIHYNSDFYDTKGFIAGKSSLNQLELELLMDIRGKSVLHLQCHFGQDTISLHRLGATVTGVDFSDKAISRAEELTRLTKTKVRFICCDIYDLPGHLDEEFDIVFTSYGTIGWLPDINKWAAIIAKFLKPKGKLVFVEFHPVVWMFDDNFKKIKYRYFNSGPIVENIEGTYAEKENSINQEYVMWNHGLGEVVNSLLANGLKLNALNEYDYSPYDCFNESEKIAYKKYRIKHLQDKIPMVYAIVATKK